MTRPRLHLPAIPHVRPWMHSCAFQGKVSKFPRMMTPLGYDVVYYGIGNDGAELGATENVGLLSDDEQIALLGHDFSDPTAFAGNDANVGLPIYQEFNRRLKSAWNGLVKEGDIVLYPFGLGHAAAHGEHKGFAVESGIGYPECFLPFRVYESATWQSWHHGKEQTPGNNYSWVIPNYFVSDDWPPSNVHGDYILFFGRICDIKGLHTVVEIAKRRPDLRFIICGQGDPTPYLTSLNIEYHPPVHGAARAELVRNAKVMLCPSAFMEPFCGSAVESQLCGTPVLSTAFGAFTETIEHGRTGYRCHTLGDFLAGLDRIETLDRAYISQRARSLYSLEAVGPQYDRVFQQLADLAGAGWYSERSQWV